MTLVANFELGKLPIVIGDLMTSIPSMEAKVARFNIPTAANANTLLLSTSGRIIARLVQKVSVLNPHLAIAWAGSELYARTILRDVLGRNGITTFQGVASILEEWQHEPGIDLYLTGIWLDEARKGERLVTRFAWDSENGFATRVQAFPDYGDCYAGGTGADAFWQLLRNARFECGENALPAETAICTSLGHLGKLAGDQMRINAGLDQFYGGGFEIVTLLDHQLQKIGDIAYHFLDARRNSDAGVTVTFHASLRVAYFEDYLLIRKFEFGGDVPNSMRTDELYVIRPVYRSVDDAERSRLQSCVRPPSMNSRFSVFYVNIPDEHGSHTRIIVHKSGLSEGSRPLEFHESEGHVEIVIAPELVERLDHAVASPLPRQP